jgi:hypothetical protein
MSKFLQFNAGSITAIDLYIILLIYIGLLFELLCTIETAIGYVQSLLYIPSFCCLCCEEGKNTNFN